MVIKFYCDALHNILEWMPWQLSFEIYYLLEIFNNSSFIMHDYMGFKFDS